MINKEYLLRACENANVDAFENNELIPFDSLDSILKKHDLSTESLDIKGIPVGNFIEGKRYIYETESTHSIHKGGTGSGKSQCSISLMIECYARSINNQSMCVSDYKGELMAQHGAFLIKKGYLVLSLNFRDTGTSLRFNPLKPAWDYYQQYVKCKVFLKNSNPSDREFMGVTYDSYEDLRSSVCNIKDESFSECEDQINVISEMLTPTYASGDGLTWEMGARRMIYCILMGMLEDSEMSGSGMTLEKFTIKNAIDISSRTENNCKELYDWIDAHDKNSITKDLYEYYTQNAKQTRDGYISSLSVKLKKWKNNRIAQVTSTSSTDIKELVKNLDKQKVAIFCITDETKSASFDLCSLFINQLMNELKASADSGIKRESDFHFLLDEFANMPKIKDFDKKISTLRSYKVWIHMGIQSYAQLSSMYGEDVMRIIKENSHTKIFYGSSDYNDLLECQREFGTMIKSVTTFGENSHGEITKTVSPKDFPIVRLCDLEKLKLGQAYVKIYRIGTFLTKLEPYFSCVDIHHEEKSLSAPKTYIDLDKITYDIGKFKCSKESKPENSQFVFDFGDNEKDSKDDEPLQIYHTYTKDELLSNALLSKRMKIKISYKSSDTDFRKLVFSEFELLYFIDPEELYEYVEKEFLLQSDYKTLEEWRSAIAKDYFMLAENGYLPIQVKRRLYDLVLKYYEMSLDEILSKKHT